MRIYFDVRRQLTVEGCIALLSTHLPERPQPSAGWIEPVMEALRGFPSTRGSPPPAVELLGTRLEGLSIFVGPLPVDLSDPHLVVSGIEGFYVRDVPGSRLDPILLAVFRAHGQVVSDLPQGPVKWVENYYDDQGLGARIWAFDEALGDGPVPAILLQTNIDDMNPELLGYLMERLLNKGARDVYFTPITMKKSRPGVTVNVLIHPRDEVSMVDILFAETTTLGIRRIPLTTWMLPRSMECVSTRYGAIRVKVGWLGQHIRSAQPEYEDCRQAALTLGVPIRDVYQETMRAFEADKPTR